MTVQSPARLPQLNGATRAICDRVADRLDFEAVGLAETATDVVLREIPEFAAMTAPPQRDAIATHSLEHVQAVIRVIRTWTLPTPDELRFVHTRAQLRASQHVPLSALLHGYRLGHRTVWECLVRLLADLDGALDAALALTTLTLSYTELISATLAEAYVDYQRGTLVQLDRARRDLLENMLDGRALLDNDGQPLQLASTFALVPGGDFLVIVLRRVGTDSTAGSEDAETRAAEILRRHLAFGVAQPFVVVRQREVVSIAPLARARASSIMHLVRQAHGELTKANERWAAGISSVCAGLGEVARGYVEARQAFSAASANGGVCALLEHRVHDFVLDHADGTARRMIPPAGRRLFESSEPGDALLVDTLNAYARAEMSVRDAADALDVHPNTVTYRLDKLGRLIGRDVTRFSELVEVLTWSRLLRKL